MSVSLSWSQAKRLLVYGVLLVLILLSGSSQSMAGGDRRAQLVEILQIEDQRQSVTSLLPYLSSRSSEVRERACLAIGRIAGPVAPDQEAPEAFSALSARLHKDRSASVRRAAAFGLGLLGNEKAAAALAARLVKQRERKSAVRQTVIEAIGRTATTLHPAAFTKGLGDSDDKVVEAALLGVWKGAALPHLPRILELSSSRKDDIRWAAAYALMRCLGARAAGRTPIAPGAQLLVSEREAILQMMVELAADIDIRVRLQALRALGTEAPDEMLYARAVSVLSNGLTAADSRERVEAVRSLGRLFAGSGDVSLITPLLEDAHPHVRIEAIRAVSGIADPPALIELLAPTFNSQNAWERAVALESASASLQEKQLYKQVLHLIDRYHKDADWTVRYTGAVALDTLWRAIYQTDPNGSEDNVDTNSTATLGHKPLIPLLEKLIDQFIDDDPKVAKGVVYPWLIKHQLEQGEFASWINWLEPKLGHADEMIRLLIIDGLSEYIDHSITIGQEIDDLPELTRLIPGMMSDPSIDVRLVVISLLEQMLTTTEETAAIELLQDIAREDGDRTVRAEAIRVIESQNMVADVAGEGGSDSMLAPGPQATEWSQGDYQQAIDKALQARYALIETSSGSLKIALFGEDAPLTVNNFITLAESGYYDNGAWHRVVPDFVVQDGCPRTDGWGGPGYAIRCEYNQHHYEPGALGMALSGKDTGGSQYFLTLSEQPHLDGRYTIFGHLETGWSVMGQIRQGEEIKSITIEYEK